MDKKLVKSLLDEALELNKELFLVDFNISDSNHISVVLDGDKGVNVKECIRVSRNIEHNLDRDTVDFSLEVSSFDVSQALKVPRQFAKNVGRKLKVKTTDDRKIEGALISFTEEMVLTLQWKERVPKPIGKGKVTVEKQEEIKMEDIKEARVIIIF